MRGIKLQLLRKRVGQSSKGGFRRGVRSITDKRVKRQDRGGEDYMARFGWGWGWIHCRFRRSKPSAESRMSNVHAGHVVGIHLVTKDFDRDFNEEAWTTWPCTIPDDVRRLAVVPRCGFREYSLPFGGILEVGANVVKFLRRSDSSLLQSWSEQISHTHGHSPRTEMYSTVSLSFSMPLATIRTLAPLEASNRATLRPMPCDPPVRTIACHCASTTAFYSMDREHPLGHRREIYFYWKMHPFCQAIE